MSKINGNNDQNKPTPKGPVIPAGTEQETGLTRGQTEKPDEDELEDTSRDEDEEEHKD